MLLTVISIVIALIALMLYQRVFIFISYKDDFSIILKYFGLKYNAQIKKPDKSSIKNEDASQKDKPKNDFDNIIKKIDNIFDLFNSIRGSLKKRIECTKCELMLDFGTGDAASTGILIGALWGSVYNLLSFSQRVIIYKPSVTAVKINIVPNFKELYFAVDFQSIFSIRLVHIIITGLILQKGIIKFKNNQKAV